MRPVSCMVLILLIVLLAAQSACAQRGGGSSGTRRPSAPPTPRPTFALLGWLGGWGNGGGGSDRHITLPPVVFGGNANGTHNNVTRFQDVLDQLRDLFRNNKRNNNKTTTNNGDNNNNNNHTGFGPYQNWTLHAFEDRVTRAFDRARRNASRLFGFDGFVVPNDTSYDEIERIIERGRRTLRWNRTRSGVPPPRRNCTDNDTQRFEQCATFVVDAFNRSLQALANTTDGDLSTALAANPAFWCRVAGNGIRLLSLCVRPCSLGVREAKHFCAQDVGDLAATAFPQLATLQVDGLGLDDFVAAYNCSAYVPAFRKQNCSEIVDQGAESVITTYEASLVSSPPTTTTSGASAALANSMATLAVLLLSVVVMYN